jgi:hypothetical protein
VSPDADTLTLSAMLVAIILAGGFAALAYFADWAARNFPDAD